MASKTDRKIVLLIDADWVCYQAASAVQKTFDWGDGDVEVSADLEEAQRSFQSTIRRIVKFRKSWATARIILCWTDRNHNWRKDVYESYKGTRGNKPVAYWDLAAWAMEEYESHQYPTLEGDDIMGILSDELSAEGWTTVKCSPDKDFRTTVGWFYWIPVSTSKRKDMLWNNTLEQADRYHMMQTLGGDTTDEYPGCKGMSVESAEKFLDLGVRWVPYPRQITKGPRKGEWDLSWDQEACDDEWLCALSCFHKAGFTTEEALQQARVARILRGSDYNREKQEVILWSSN